MFIFLEKRQLVIVFLLINLVIHPSQDKKEILLAGAGVLCAAAFNTYRICKIESRRKEEVVGCANVLRENLTLKTDLEGLKSEFEKIVSNNDNENATKECNKNMDTLCKKDIVKNILNNVEAEIKFGKEKYDNQQVLVTNEETGLQNNFQKINNMLTYLRKDIDRLEDDKWFTERKYIYVPFKLLIGSVYFESILFFFVPNLIFLCPLLCKMLKK